MPSPQNRTPEALFAMLGASGFAGITAAADGTTASTLDITVSGTAWALLTDGTMLNATSGQLVTTSLTGNTTNGAYTLYLDYAWGNEDVKPVWSVAATAPSANALAVASVTVAGGVVSAVVLNPSGVANYPLAGVFQTTAPAAGGGAALPATPVGYGTVLFNGVARRVALY